MSDDNPRHSAPETKPSPAPATMPAPTPQRATESFEKAARTGSAQMMADSVPVAPSGSLTEVPSALAGPPPAAGNPSSPPAASDAGGTE